MSKLAFKGQPVEITYFPFRQGFFGKKRFNDRSSRPEGFARYMS